MNRAEKHTTMKKVGNGYMFKIGKYKIIITKEKDPVRLQKKITEKEKLEQIVNRNADMLNIILMVVLMILLLMLCMILVPKTYGFFSF